MKPDIEGLKNTSISLSGKCPGVYFLFDRNELVYVGQGWNCFLRVAEHTRKEKRNYKEFTSWNYIRIDNEMDRKILEKELRAKIKTKYNKI